MPTSDRKRLMPAPVLPKPAPGRGVVGRLAPSPTGLLHLGNAWAFWLAWLETRSQGGRLILRMEDLDPARSKAHFAQAAREDLRWLGLDWDAESPPQSQRSPAYEQALARLEAQALTYPCFCTRKELRSLAGAPQVGDEGAPYPGLCRNLSQNQRKMKTTEGRKSSSRLICPAEAQFNFNDRIMGRQSLTLSEVGGDFALRRSDGVYAYQLAVVVDDLEAGVSSVTRGRDILASTPRQLYLISLLGGAAPQYAHLPLIVDHLGERLAKRHQALGLRALKEAGVRPQAIFGFLAGRSGLRASTAPLDAGELLGADLAKLNFPSISLPPFPLKELLKQ